MTTFTTTGAVLHEAAAWAARVVPTRTTAPVLAGLVLDAGDNLRIAGYDFETHAEAIIPAVTAEPGRILLSARLLTAVTKTVDRDVDVTITDDSGAVEVRCGRSEWTLPGLPVADYPQLPRLGEPAGTVNAGLLRSTLARVLPIVSKDAQPAALAGVKVESDGDELTVIGTDRYRLAAATIPWQPAAPDLCLEALVPGPLFDTAARAAAGDADQVTLHVGDTNFSVVTDTRTVTGRQMAEDYVRWRNVMPEPSEHHALVNVASLNAAADQALVAADQAAQLLLTFTEDGVEVSAAGENRRARADADAELTGDPITVKVNSRYLRDALTLHGSDQVTVHFGGNPHRPFLVLGDDPNYRHTVTPVRLTGAERAAA